MVDGHAVVAGRERSSPTAALYPDDELDGAKDAAEAGRTDTGPRRLG
ncbi:MAG: hypothetical protein WKF58_02810 [Ilumatobacteraceae bacterium]